MLTDKMKKFKNALEAKPSLTDQDRALLNIITRMDIFENEMVINENRSSEQLLEMIIRPAARRCPFCDHPL